MPTQQQRKAILSLSPWLFAGLSLVSTVAMALGDSEKKQLIYLLEQDCGSCHGMRLTGGLGPSLLPADLQKKGHAYVSRVISHGISGTAMPPWKTILNPEEIQFLVDYLLRSTQNP